MSSVQLPGEPSHKLLLGRLYHAGIKLSALCETFEVDPKNLHRWGQALGAWWGVKPVTSYRTPKPGGSWMRLGVAKLLESEKLASGFGSGGRRPKGPDLNISED